MSAGLMITTFGLLLAFTFMGIFIGTIVLLQKLFPAKSKDEEEAGEIEEVMPVVTAAETGEGDAVIAAIAVALHAMRSVQQSELGSALQDGHSTWWVSKRIAASQNVGWAKK